MADEGEFDFAAAFAGFDVLQGEATAEIVGRILAKFYKGMIEAGLTDSVVNKVIETMLSVLMKEMTRLAMESYNK